LTCVQSSSREAFVSAYETQRTSSRASGSAAASDAAARRLEAKRSATLERSGRGRERWCRRRVIVTLLRREEARTSVATFFATRVPTAGDVRPRRLVSNA
jgi:hypothetical protein